MGDRNPIQWNNAWKQNVDDSTDEDEWQELYYPVSIYLIKIEMFLLLYSRPLDGGKRNY